MIVEIHRNDRRKLKKLLAPRVKGGSVFPGATIRVSSWAGGTFEMKVTKLSEIKGRQGVTGRVVDPETGRNTGTKTWCYLYQVVEVTKAVA